MRQTVLGKRQWMLLLHVLLCSLVTISQASVGDPSARHTSSSSRSSPPPPLQKLWRQIRWNGSGSTTHSIPALNVIRTNRNERTNTEHKRKGSDLQRTIEVAAVKQKRRRPRRKLQIDGDQAKKAMESSGFYYGVSTETLSKATHKDTTKRPPRLAESMEAALEELRFLREEMGTVKQELRKLKSTISGEEAEEMVTEEERSATRQEQRRLRQESETIARDVERWAQDMIHESEEDGWKPVSCNKMMKRSLNPTGRTTVYLKWMKDSRGDRADATDDIKYPCMKCYSTIDAPLEDVCTYLSQESAMGEYNDLVVKYKDVEDISPNVKVCWSQTPKILFLKPRDFVTLCHHRWRKDGSQVVVNQAWSHPAYPGINEEREGKACRALAIRGANFFSRCPDDPDKTVITLVAHASPGGGVPQWACKTAVNALAPIEPFKLFHRINDRVIQSQTELRERLEQAEMVSTQPPGRSPRPAGIAQMGYACFWPNGGGMQEGGGYRISQPDSESLDGSHTGNVEEQEEPLRESQEEYEEDYEVYEESS